MVPGVPMVPVVPVVPGVPVGPGLPIFPVVPGVLWLLYFQDQSSVIMGVRELSRKEERPPTG